MQNYDMHYSRHKTIISLRGRVALHCIRSALAACAAFGSASAALRISLLHFCDYCFGCSRDDDTVEAHHRAAPTGDDSGNETILLPIHAPSV